ncbi:MAG: substrate-binding domain-containing protein [Dehalococcoidales bacterium]|nr:substrate-binding domain-containing protein [Dehalococcoidales bacterium]
MGSFIGCSRTGENPKLSVFAAGGAKPAIDEICALFTEEYSTDIDINYGGGGEVLSRMVLSETGDIYIAPEQRFMESALEKNAIVGATVKNLAFMIPVIAVPEGNPKGITCLSDLAKPGIRVAITRSETTLLGIFAPEIFEKAGLAQAIGENIIATASDPNNLLTMLTTNAIDAGIIWHFFSTSASDKIDIVWLLPEQLTGVGQMQTAVSAYSENTETALAFIEFLVSPQGKLIFQKHGYITEIEEVNRYWK